MTKPFNREPMDDTWMSRLFDAAQAATLEANVNKMAFIYFGPDLEPKFMTYKQVEDIFKSPLILSSNNVSL